MENIPIQSTKIQRLSILDKYINEIKRYMSKGINAKRIYDLIKDEGFEGSYSSVRKKVHIFKGSVILGNTNTGKLNIDKQSLLKSLCKST